MSSSKGFIDGKQFVNSETESSAKQKNDNHILEASLNR